MIERMRERDVSGLFRNRALTPTLSQGERDSAGAQKCAKRVAVEKSQSTMAEDSVLVAAIARLKTAV
jgi:hypothetical protein